VFEDPEALAKLESIVHPLVRVAEDKFRADAEARGSRVAVLNTPLLLETGGGERVDAVVVVTAPAEVQRKRLFERPNMTEEKFRAMLARQMSDSEKRRRADFIIDTSRGFDAARADVRRILRELAGEGALVRRK
jgi:dephospho-CoA kinase